MASRRTSVSRASSPTVHLLCGNCDKQLGTFNNEWIRLTSSYARAKHNGTHINTQIGEILQYVPAGTVQAAAEGCGMAEVFCKGCSDVVGRYCKNVPCAEKEYLLDTYFYKLSRTYLMDPESGGRVEPIFGYAGDLTMAPPRSRASVRPSRQASARPRTSMRPPATYTPRDSLGTFSEIGAGYRQSVDRNSFAEMREDSVVAERLSFLERRISDYETDRFRQSGTMTPLNGFGYQSQNGSQADTSSQQASEQDSTVEEQRKQITALTSQIQILNGTIRDLRSLIKEMCSDKQPQPSQPGASERFQDSKIDSMSAAIASAQHDQSEAARLREENERLRAKFAIIEGAMGTEPGTISRLGPGLNLNGVRNGATSPDQMSAVPESRGVTVAIAQLPTPAASQQTSFSDNESAPKPAARATRNSTSGLGAERLLNSAGRAEKVKEQSTMESTDEMQIGDDYVQFGGDEDVEEPTAREPSNPHASKALDPTSAGNEEFPGETNTGSQVYVYPGEMAFKAASSGHSSSEEISSAQELDKASLKYATATKRSSDGALFGVIKPMSVKERRKMEREYKAQEFNHYEPPVIKGQSSVQIQVQQAEPDAPVIHAPRPIDPDVVYFSDDEDVAPSTTAAPSQQPSSAPPMELHYGRGRAGPPAAPGVSPWAQLTPLSLVGPSAKSTPDVAGSLGGTDSARSESSDIEIDIIGPDQMRQIIEREESGIKEPKPKKIPVQTTEKLLNEELMELGLEEWIGKEKNTKEYRQIIERARAERRERNKLEALARAGVIKPDAAAAAAAAAVAVPVPKKKPAAKPGRPRKHKSLQSLRRHHNKSAKATLPLADVTDQQNEQATGRKTRKRKVDVVEEEETEDLKVPVESTVPKAKRAKREPTGKSQRFWPEADVTPGTENADVGVKTRRQMREAEIDKLDKLAMEAMETEEADS